MTTSRRLLFVCLCLFVASGCNTQFRDSRTIDLGAGEVVDIAIDPAANARTITVTAMAEEPVSVYFYLDENSEEVNRKITLGSETDLILAKAENTKDIKLSAELPADKAATVMYKSTGPATKVQAEMTD